MMDGDYKPTEPLSRLSSRQSSQDSYPSSSSPNLSRQSSQTSSSSIDSTEHSLYQRLKRKVIENADTGDFLPRGAIAEIITVETIEAQFPWYNIFKVRSSCSSDQVVQQAKGVLAILGLCEKESDIWNLFNEGKGLTDDHLPLELRANGLSNVLVSRGGREFKSFLSWKDIEIECFFKKQWLVLAPVLEVRGQHIPMGGEVPLPFYDMKVVSHGFTSTVYKGRLPASHVIPKANNDPRIAIKRYGLEEYFEREKDNLENIQKLDHPHLIQHIATIQKGNSFYAILYWADGGNLCDFWERNPDFFLTRRSGLFIWCFQQMLGLVEGLFALHEKGCRHGDLKPENILHFQNSDDPKIHHGEYGTLIIADVGISRVHHIVTELRHDRTKTYDTTRSYEGPEAETGGDKPRSRRYDMWSVGCIFMEFAIWLLYGYKAINAFRERRKEFSPKAAYYEFTNPTVKINPAVEAELKALRNDAPCTGLTELVDLIANDLIVIEPKDRAEAGALRDKFRQIWRKVTPG
ncbi:hypothetical protein ANO14919_011590 [Xylariales sp. No.14919]|nr:hypothetical protein ANO14919_011590 [Xylariales sp. No.14919]